MLSKSRRGVICVTVLVAIAGAGCKKKTAIGPPTTSNPTTSGTVRRRRRVARRSRLMCTAR